MAAAKVAAKGLKLLQEEKCIPSGSAALVVLQLILEEYIFLLVVQWMFNHKM